MNPLNSIIRQSTRKINDKLNILTFVSHERFEPNLCKTGHNFYSISQCPDCDARIWQTKYSAIPKNYHILYDGKIPNHVFFDLIIAHNQFVHLPFIAKFRIPLPVINVFHTMPTPGWSKQHTQQHMPLFDVCNQHVFISEFNKNAWFFNDKPNTSVIEHGIDTNFFKPDRDKIENNVLSVANDFINRDWALGFSLWKQIASKIKCKVIGKTEGLSQPASSINEILKEYQSSLIYLNTSLHSPIPMSVLEAMACGCCVVSTNTCMMPDIIQQGENGFIFSPKNPNKFLETIQFLINNNDEAIKIGNNARKTIQDMFSMDKFVLQWEDVIAKVI